MHMRPFGGSHCCLYLPIDLYPLLSQTQAISLFFPVKSSLTVAAAASIVYCFYAIVCLLP